MCNSSNFEQLHITFPRLYMSAYFKYKIINMKTQRFICDEHDTIQNWNFTKRIFQIINKNIWIYVWKMKISISDHDFFVWRYR